MSRVLLLTGPAAQSLPVTLPVARALGAVSVLSIMPPDGPEQAALRAALSSGAERATTVWDELLTAADYYAVAQTLAAAARKIGFEIIVCSDGRRCLLGPALADQLGIPHLSGVSAAALRDGRVVARRAGWGVSRAYAAEPPLLLSLAHGQAPPSDATASTEPPSGEPEIEHLSLADVGISPAEIRWRNRFAPRLDGSTHAPAPPPRTFARASDLAARLVADGLLPSRGASGRREGGSGT